MPVTFYVKVSMICMIKLKTKVDCSSNRNKKPNLREQAPLPSFVSPAAIKNDIIETRACCLYTLITVQRCILLLLVGGHLLYVLTTS